VCVCVCVCVCMHVNQALAQVYWEGVNKYQGFGADVDWIHETDYYKMVRKEVLEKASVSSEALLESIAVGGGGNMGRPPR